MPPIEPNPREIVTEDELRSLLLRLDGLGASETSGEGPITVEDVAEALDMDPQHVARELAAMHQERAEARLSQAMRELEEPLYRVERPATTQPHLTDPIFRLRSVRALMERNAGRPRLPRRAIEGDEHAHRMSTLAGAIVLIVALALVVALVWRG